MIKNIIGLFLYAIIVGAVPKSINYQGKLLDSTGVGVNDTLQMVFRLYTSETGGSPIWVDTVENVVIRQGLFSVELGEFPDSVDFSTQYWLEVEIEGETFSPRERLLSAPYSIRAAVADRIGTGMPNKVAFWLGDGFIGYDSTFHWDTANRRLGIGTTSPSTKLQVVGTVRASGFSAPDGTAGSPAYYFANDGDVGLFRPGTNQLAITTGGVERLRIMDNGNIGIGTPTPTARLYVKTTDTTVVPFQIEAPVLILEGWQYRKRITISGSPGAGTNYQVLLKVGESAGATGAHFHVEGHSANFPPAANNSGDLRFTADDGITPLNFWVEKVEGSSPNRVAYCWVKVTQNLDMSQNIYCYYGNSDANNVSDLSNTFILEISNLVASWNFDEGSGTIAYDKSGNNNNGTLFNGPTWVNGKFDKALNFDGYDDYIEVPHSSTLAMNRAISVCVWVQIYPSQTMVRKNDNDYLFEWGDGSTNNPGTTPQWFVNTTNGSSCIWGNAPLTQGNWYFICGVYDADLQIQKIYVNGSEYPTSSSISWGTLRNSFSYLRIGNWSSEKFRGILDELKLFNKALSIGEVTALYNHYGYVTTSYAGKVLVRKFTAPEPAFLTTGEEELNFLNQTVFMIQNRTGNVGIGSSNPIYKLDVNGPVRASQYITGDILFQRNGELLWRMFEDENGIYLQNTRTGRIYRIPLEEVR